VRLQIAGLREAGGIRAIGIGAAAAFRQTNSASTLLAANRRRRQATRLASYSATDRSAGRATNRASDDVREDAGTSATTVIATDFSR
jgi:hypothetical protein